MPFGIDRMVIFTVDHELVRDSAIVSLSGARLAH